MDQLNKDGFLAELLALGREPWETNPIPDTTTAFLAPNTSWASLDHGFEGHLAPILSHHAYFNDFSSSIKSGLAGTAEFPLPEVPGSSLSYCNEEELCALPFPFLADHEEDFSLMKLSMMDEAEQQAAPGGPQLGDHGLCWCPDFMPESCTMAAATLAAETDPVSINSVLHVEGPRRKSRVVKKVEAGQPSKNLMAERRRRKRLNDRLSMLRSVVPKISKMDRTSILGDTIDYMKELLGKINSLQVEINDGGSSQWSAMSFFKEARTVPQFDVERRHGDTRVEISCAGKPGLLLSTIDTLEALGLEIQECVVSCFSDFSFQASCSEELEQRELMTSEHIKQALLQNAGYGGGDMSSQLRVCERRGRNEEEEEEKLYI